MEVVTRGIAGGLNSTMGLVQRFAARRYLKVLRNADLAPAAEVIEAQTRLQEAGAPVLPAILEAVSEGCHHSALLETVLPLITNENVDRVVAAMVGGDSTSADFWEGALSRSTTYDARLLFDLLDASGPARPRLERVLRARCRSFRWDVVQGLVQGASRERLRVILSMLETRREPSAIQIVMSLLESPDAWARIHAICFLAAADGTEGNRVLESEGVADAIGRTLRDREPTVRRAAVTALGKLRARSHIAPLCQSLRDPDLKVSSAAIEALVTIGDPSAVRFLVDVLKDDSEYARRGAVEVLNEVATPEAIADLVHALQDEDWWVRVRAADALGALGGDRVVEAVLSLVRSEDVFVRRYAIEILNSIPSERSVPALIDALSDVDWWVRERAIDALGKTKDPRAVAPLLLQLRADPEVATLVLGALVRVGDATALAAVLELTSISRQDLRDAARKALRELARTSPDLEVRKNAARALSDEEEGAEWGRSGGRSSLGPVAGGQRLGEGDSSPRPPKQPQRSMAFHADGATRIESRLPELGLGPRARGAGAGSSAPASRAGETDRDDSRHSDRRSGSGVDSVGDSGSGSDLDSSSRSRSESASTSNSGRARRSDGATAGSGGKRSDRGPGSASRSGTDAGAGSRGGAGTGRSANDSRKGSRPRADGGTRSGTDSGTGNRSVAGSRSGTGSGAGSRSGAESGPDSRSGNRTGSASRDADPGSDSRSGTGPRSGSRSDTGSNPASDSGSRRGTTPGHERAPTDSSRSQVFSAGTPMRRAGDGAEEAANETSSYSEGSPKSGSSPISLFDFPRLPPGTWLLDRYRVLQKIGEGGFGYVYLVRDQSIGEDIILKILAPQISLDESMIKRFVHELKYNRRIVHPNVIRLYDFLELNPGHAISMEYFPSEDLGSLLARTGTLDADRLLRITQQLCVGLKAAHDSGIVHRDIKPPNILIGEGDRTKIVDFGLAAASGMMNQSRVTKSGILVGTPQYMAPEQIRGNEIDHRTDIYALGVLLFECLCGTPPYESDNPVSVLMMHLTDPIPNIKARVPGVPPVLEWLIPASLAKDPAERPQSVDDVLAEIEKRAA